MNSNVKTALIVAACLIVAAGAFTYGALTAPNQQKRPTTISPKPSPSVKIDLSKQLKEERSVIVDALISSYPKIKTLYAIGEGKLYDKGQWYGTILTYKGKDDANRDTLRVLMEKKNGEWKLRTTPPQPLLSTVEFPDAPRSVIKEINEPVSLPAGKGSPELSANE